MLVGRVFLVVWYEKRRRRKLDGGWMDNEEKKKSNVDERDASWFTYLPSIFIFKPASAFPPPRTDEEKPEQFRFNGSTLEEVCRCQIPDGRLPESNPSNQINDIGMQAPTSSRHQENPIHDPHSVLRPTGNIPKVPNMDSLLGSLP